MKNNYLTLILIFSILPLKATRDLETRPTPQAHGTGQWRNKIDNIIDYLEKIIAELHEIKEKK